METHARQVKKMFVPIGIAFSQYLRGQVINLAEIGINDSESVSLKKVTIIKTPQRIIILNLKKLQ